MSRQHYFERISQTPKANNYSQREVEYYLETLTQNKKTAIVPKVKKIPQCYRIAS